MNIDFQPAKSHAPIFDTNTDKGRQAHANIEAAVPIDQVQTSSKALILSRGLVQLQEQLAPRAEMINKFSSFVEEPLNLDDKVIDRIIDKMFSE